MCYFDAEFIDFFQGLAGDNSKAYFDANRETYERAVKEPFKELVQDIILRVKEHEPELAIEPKDAIFRINRDIRFSKDKRPYKEHMSAHVSRGGRKDHSHPGLYFQVSHEGVHLGGGAYMLDREGLQSIRRHIADNMDEFSALLAEPGFRAMWGEVRGDKHKRVPKEFQEAHADQPLIANKQFYFWTELGPEVVTSADLVDVLMEHYLASLPVSRFLEKALNP